MSIIEEPRTDKECYVPGDQGMLTVSYRVAESVGPLDKYKVVWSVQKDGTGIPYIRGPAVLIYMNRDDRMQHEARWRSRVSYHNWTVSCKLEVVSMTLLDDIPHLFAFIVDGCSGQIVAVSESTARISVSEKCPSTASPTSSSTLKHESQSSTEEGKNDFGAIPFPESLRRLGTTWRKH